MILHATSTSHRSQSNGRIDNAIGQVIMGSRALLEQSGLPLTWWTWAAPYWCSLHNVLGKPGTAASPYWQRHGAEFTGEIVPFGA
eukprot:9310325-Heterocapsa_arctica.AAC.1